MAAGALDLPSRHPNVRGDPRGAGLAPASDARAAPVARGARPLARALMCASAAGTLCPMGSPTDGPLPAIVARGVTKTFRVPEERRHTLKERVLHPRRRTRYQTFDALRDISLT